jgi:ferric-dicitrate binding protein FerR (iron transport regulator)
MTLRHLFAINFFFAVFFGVSGSFFPRTWVLLYGLAPSEATTWVIRLAGGSLLGFSTLMWFGYRSASRETRRAIAVALLVQDAVGTLASVAIQLQGAVNALGRSNVAGYLLLALGYAYFLVLRPESS